MKKEKRVKVNKKSKIKSVTLNENKEYLRRKDKVTSFFLNPKYVPMKINEISACLGIKKSDKIILKSILEELVEQSVILKNSDGKYSKKQEEDDIIATFEKSNDSFGFAVCDNKDEEDIYIPYKYSKGAITGDKILVVIDAENNSFKGKKRVGKVVKIIKRAFEYVVGKVYYAGKKCYVLPITKDAISVYITKIDRDLKLKSGMFVKVRITNYISNNSCMEGYITEIIEGKNETNVYVNSLFSSYDLDKKIVFPKSVEKEVNKLPSNASKGDLKLRENKTKDNVYTIDSEDSKDLDDAICVKKLKNGNYMLSVHIADVSYYVRENTKVDKEAVKRGTSIYIPGKVIPMLPQKLSNGICSLNEGEIRLTLSVDMEISKSGDVINHRIYKGYIKSKKKMTYEKVYACIIKSDKKVLKEYKEFLSDIENMLELSKILRNKRLNEGSINFEIPETKVCLDENGSVIDICEYKKNIANNIIEEFMLVTNRVVAEKFNMLSAPFIYRVHEKPDEDKLRDLNKILALYNKKIKTVKNITPKMISNLISNFETEEEKQVINSLTLRTLKLARYDSNCLGHFGLAFKYYCHFTSPIRRYPDLFIHRVISSYLENEYHVSKKIYNDYLSKTNAYSLSSFETEKEATKIERDFDNLYEAIYMSSKVSEEFDGVISSITSFGMFVRLPNTVEGLVHVSSLKGYYNYDESRYILSSKSGKSYKIGDKVKVRVEKVDIMLRQIDFSIIGEVKSGRKGK